MKTWFITGASSGLGRCLAEAVLASGDKVAGAARRTELLKDMEAAYPGSALAVKLDVTQVADIAAALAEAERQLGPIEVLVNNAGYGLFGAIEELTAEEYRPLYETNLFGAIEVMRAAAEGMRARRSGVIVTVSSSTTVSPMAGGGHYAATKLALEAITECMAAELAEYGVRTLIVLPSQFRTPGFDAQQFPKAPMAAYANTTGKLPEMIAALGKVATGDPVKAARAILDAVNDPESLMRLPLGETMVPRATARYRALSENMESLRDLSASTVFDRS